MRCLLIALTLLSSHLVLAKEISLGAQIINGSTASFNQFPWQVALIDDPDNPFTYCGGSIVHEKWILTAAHCAENNPNGTFTFVLAGTRTLDQNSEEFSQGNSYRGTWHVHEDYDDFLLDNDIALIELDTPIDLEICEQCKSIDLVTSETESDVASEGSLTRVSGWGTTATDDESSFATSLMWTSLFLTHCTNAPSLWFESEITDNMICASDSVNASDSCQGDSGGPLVVENSNGTGYLLAGIVSFGAGCAQEGFPGVYTRVANYTNWLRSFDTEISPRPEDDETDDNSTDDSSSDDSSSDNSASEDNSSENNDSQDNSTDSDSGDDSDSSNNNSGDNSSDDSNASDNGSDDNSANDSSSDNDSNTTDDSTDNASENSESSDINTDTSSDTSSEENLDAGGAGSADLLPLLLLGTLSYLNRLRRRKHNFLSTRKHL